MNLLLTEATRRPEFLFKGAIFKTTQMWRNWSDGFYIRLLGDSVRIPPLRETRDAIVTADYFPSIDVLVSRVDDET